MPIHTVAPELANALVDVDPALRARGQGVRSQRTAGCVLEAEDTRKRRHDSDITAQVAHGVDVHPRRGELISVASARSSREHVASLVVFDLLPAPPSPRPASTNGAGLA